MSFTTDRRILGRVVRRVTARWPPAAAAADRFNPEFLLCSVQAAAETQSAAAAAQHKLGLKSEIC